MAINPDPPPTAAAGWYDAQANPPTLHGPFAEGQPAAIADAQANNAAEPRCFRWADQATLSAMLGI